ncbi:DoxX family membrane protein [Streptomyces sp. NPDC048001]|uniref:DoxX family protein n=1 Tax=unclassified Streptomyces TaxID=2593676 RepID=UPI00372141D2
MSVDTRTPRSGFDDQPALSMVKVHCDPAQVIVNHASFRVQLPRNPRPARAMADTARIASFGTAGAVGAAAAGAAGGGATGRAARRRAPVVWSGRSTPGDAGATGLLQAVRDSSAGTLAPPAPPAPREAPEQGGYSAGATQAMPRVDLVGDTVQRSGPLLPPMRQAVGAYDTPSFGPEEYGEAGGDDGAYDLDPLDGETGDEGRSGHRASGDHTRHAYYPDRRMNLGVVLLPLRILLGFISVYAGMGKLCDPVYFDGGERGSLVRWLESLQPWAMAEPMRDLALAHPVGSGLTVAFLQVIVGVLTLLGLWQRVAAGVGVLLSAALLLTVSWRTVPVYDAPDIIFLAAWSPLIIAGAPVYSVDARLSGEAWRALGPRSELWDLRRRVLRRGGLVAAVVVGLTMLIGSMLGGAVRSTEIVTVPGPGQDPTNYLPGAPLPQESGTQRRPAERKSTPTPSASRSASTEPPTTAPAPETAPEPGRVADAPSSTQGTGQQPPPADSQPAPPPSTSAGPTSSGGTGSGGAGSAGPTGGTTGGPGDGSGPGSGSGGAPDGGSRVIGGLLG